MALILVITAVVSAALFAWISIRMNSEFPKRKVEVQIKEGMSARAIGVLLQEKKVIKSALLFVIAIKRRGVESDIKPGTYIFATGMDYDKVIDKLINGPPINYIKLTLPEGWTAKQMADRVSSITKIDRDEYLGLSTDDSLWMEYPFLMQSGAPVVNLEGFLYPQTYRILNKTTARELVKMQLDQFMKATSDLNWSNAESLGRTPYEIIIIASLIERETVVKDERPIVASVIYNRLAKNMRLQIDATVQYALPVWKKRLTYEDLKVDSPYNTYRNPGLPPGPICNPGYESIKAALNPAKTDYLYYVLAPDNSGRHVFTSTYDEFLKAKAQYDAARRQ